MAETLGSLCDKLTIVKLKQWHTEDQSRLASLGQQEHQLISEIDEYVHAAASGMIPYERLKFPSNKVFKNQNAQSINYLASESLGIIFSQLAEANCALWHEQEKVYNFVNIPVDQKDQVVNQLAVLNLKRT